ncbi:MAG: metallophosphoesterase [Thermoguttaceae bacterium]|jgi:3',5'-cyclic AMP phosphodiesterase CpdA
MPICLPPISRRRFLAGSLAAGASLFLPRPTRGAEGAADPDRWILLADTHIWERQDAVTRGTNPAANLARAAREILALRPRPAGVVLAGDTVYMEGHAADYAAFRDLIRPIRAAGIPMHVALGNHDHRENFWAAFPDCKPRRPPAPDRHLAIVETPNANWFLLDSLDKTNSTPGRLGQPQLDWLAAALDARSEKPAILVAHHDLGTSRGLLDSEALVDVAAGRKQVKAYFYGHTHAWQVGKQGELHLVNVPAMAWLFDPSQPRGWVDVSLRPGGAALVLHALDHEHPKHGEQTDLKWRT